MLKRFAFLFALVTVAFLTTANAQNWKFNKEFPHTGFNPTPISGSGINNCLTVDPMGRVWMASYRYADSILNASGQYILVRSTYVFNPDGTPASFSPIHVYTSKDGSIKDTLNGVIMGYSYGYGMTTGPDGNIYAITPSVYLYKLDYHDGSVLQKIKNPIPGYSSSIASCAVDAAGEVFMVPVISGPGPIALSADFSSVVSTIDTSAWGGVARDIEVSADGNDVYIPYFAGAPGSPCVYHYHSASGTLGTYTMTDTLFKGLSVESMTWQPKTGYLWCSSGGTKTAPSTAGAGYSPFTWYAFDMSNPSKPVLKDSLTWDLSASGISADSALTTLIDCRGIAFSPSGDTAYVAMFNMDSNCVQMFTGKATAVNQAPNAIPASYSLSQNYPNPFNPSTKINYALKANGHVTLAVYDVLGRQVASLVNGYQSAGQYSVDFNAAGLASGVYFYTLRTSNGVSITKKMLLMK